MGSAAIKKTRRINSIYGPTGCVGRSAQGGSVRSVPEGFQLADEPKALDSTLVGSTIYMRWEDYGWQLGKITDTITSATPQRTPRASSRVASPTALCGRTGTRARTLGPIRCSKNL